MKRLLLMMLVVICVVAGPLAAQSGAFRAQARYYTALEAFQADEYFSALESTREAKQILGGTNVLLQYLHIMAAYEAGRPNEAFEEIERFFRLVEGENEAENFPRGAEELSDDEVDDILRIYDEVESAVASGIQDRYNYDIGDPGPAGGLIFFDDEDNGSDDYAFRYLEAAPASTEWNDIEYGGSNVTDINGDDDTVPPELEGVGAGQANTMEIVNELGDNGGTDYAAKLADDLEHDGYTDWFLPSKDELELMYENLHEDGLGGFEWGGRYLSSSERVVWNATFALSVEFSTGDLYLKDKDSGGRVRAVRAFGN